MRKAGAILLGKTNTPEFTLGGFGGISTASNLLYGSSHNPYDLTRSTAGSSGGAGAVVAAGLAAFDIGSDWGGSIRGPSHNNGIAGIKPTSVRVPRTGHIVDYGGIFDLWQQLGPMARRVEDLALITPIISGPDFRDASCAPVPWADPAAVEAEEARASPSAPTTARPAATPRRRHEEDRAPGGEVAGGRRRQRDAKTRRRTCSCELAAARRELSRGDGGAFYQRLADKWGTKNILAARARRSMAPRRPSAPPR